MLNFASETLKEDKVSVMDAVNPDLRKDPEVILEMMKRLGLGEAKYAAPNVDTQSLLEKIPAEKYVGSCQNISIFDSAKDNRGIEKSGRVVSTICSFLDVASLSNLSMCSPNANEIVNDHLKEEMKSARP
ncbi:MAG: hypothetical protein VX835_04760 [Pseudomonadota bacterium]|nr:hypothetical protein [Pseudomonadota bacterium]